jgi:hypothetical protein
VGSLSEIQKQLILGCVLGDGYIRKKVNAHLQVTHSIKQKEYVDWKYKMLDGLVNSHPKIYKGNGNRVGYRFFTKSLPQLTQIYHYFYKGGVKIVPKGLKLTPLSLAVWYMDDGSRSRKASYFNCQQFDRISRNNMIKMLSSVGLKATLNKDKSYFRIYISSYSTPHLVSTIKQHIIPSMRYKLPI